MRKLFKKVKPKPMPYEGQKVWQTMLVFEDKQQKQRHADWVASQ